MEAFAFHCGQCRAIPLRRLCLAQHDCGPTLFRNRRSVAHKCGDGLFTFSLSLACANVSVRWRNAASRAEGTLTNNCESWSADLEVLCCEWVSDEAKLLECFCPTFLNIRWLCWALPASACQWLSSTRAKRQVRIVWLSFWKGKMERFSVLQRKLHSCVTNLKSKSSSEYRPWPKRCAVSIDCALPSVDSYWSADQKKDSFPSVKIKHFFYDFNLLGKFSKQMTIVMSTSACYRSHISTASSLSYWPFWKREPKLLHCQSSMLRVSSKPFTPLRSTSCSCSFHQI